MPRILQSMAVAAKATERSVYMLKCIIMFLYFGAAVSD